MKFIGISSLLLLLPIALIVIALWLFIPFAIRNTTRNIKDKLDNENEKMLAQVADDKKPLSKEEKLSYCRRLRNIIINGRREIEEKLGTDDLRKGSKELSNELKTMDIRETFSSKYKKKSD